MKVHLWRGNVGRIADELAPALAGGVTFGYPVERSHRHRKRLGATAASKGVPVTGVR
jgi:hypothetical protein